MTNGVVSNQRKGKSPAAQWYWADWLRDPALRSVTSGARGLWMDMLCLMWECVPRGHLQNPSGKPFSTEMICRATGNISKEEVDQWLGELENAGVSSLSGTGVIYSRRMVRDEHKRAACREAGKRGGNPALKGGVKGAAKGRPKGAPKRKPTPSSSPSGEDGKSDPGNPAEVLIEFPESLRTTEFIEAWRQWRDFRKEKKKTMSDRAIKMTLKRLGEWGSQRAVAAIEFSIANDYQGVFEESRNGSKPPVDLFAGQRDFLEKHRNASQDFNA